MISKRILFAGTPCDLACDAQCQKAWGINNRPRVYLQDPELKVYGEGYSYYLFPDNEMIDLDDQAYLADGELGEASADPGTYEGEHGKPQHPDERLNKWCARECERSVMVNAGLPIELPDFSKRQYNCAPHVRE